MVQIWFQTQKLQLRVQRFVSNMKSEIMHSPRVVSNLLDIYGRFTGFVSKVCFKTSNMEYWLVQRYFKLGYCNYRRFKVVSKLENWKFEWFKGDTIQWWYKTQAIHRGFKGFFFFFQNLKNCETVWLKGCFKIKTWDIIHFQRLFHTQKLQLWKFKASCQNLKREVCMVQEAIQKLESGFLYGSKAVSNLDIAIIEDSTVCFKTWKQEFGMVQKVVLNSDMANMEGSKVCFKVEL